MTQYEVQYYSKQHLGWRFFWVGYDCTKTEWKHALKQALIVGWGHSKYRVVKRKLPKWEVVQLIARPLDKSK